MATETTVDLKPMDKLPFDPATIPDAVKKRAAAVDLLYSTTAIPKTAGQDSSQPVPVVAEKSPPPGDAAATTPLPQAPAPQSSEPPPQQKQAPAAPSQRPADDADSWKHQSLSWQGRYNASQKTISEMQEQMTQLGNELLQMQRFVTSSRPPAPPPPVVKNYLTDQDVQNYGTELIDLTQRAAAQVVAPQIEQIQQQNADLQRRLAVEARRNLDQRVELAVPNFREIDKNPRWHSWLLQVDLLSGRVRQQLLNEAISAANAPRVISFFRGFLQEEVATGHSEPAPVTQRAAPPRVPAVELGSLAAPGRARPAGGDATMPPDKPIYTRAQISQLYEQHRKGAYVGREAEWARQEADFFTAQREGRVR